MTTMKAKDLFQLCNRLSDIVSEEFDMSLDGTNQKSFHKKYGMLLYHLMVYLMCTQLTPTPMLITLKKYDGHAMYYGPQGLYNGSAKIPLSPLHHNAIKNLIDDQPDRVYLFSPCTTLPSELTPKDKARIGNHFFRLLKQYNPKLKPCMYKDKTLSTSMMTLLLFSVAHHNGGYIKFDV